MRSLKPVAALMTLATLPAVAPADDVSDLRAELQTLKNDYNSRVDALETRIKQIEAANAAAADAATALAAAPPPPEPAPAAPAGGGATAFNPAISLILGGSYTDTSRDPADWRIGGFPRSGDEIG